MLYVFKSCRHMIRTLPVLVYDEHKVEDVDTTQEDHLYDALKYVCMENPLNPPRMAVWTPPQEDPLNMWN